MSSRNGCFQNERPYCFIFRQSVTALIVRASRTGFVIPIQPE